MLCSIVSFAGVILLILISFAVIPKPQVHAAWAGVAVAGFATMIHALIEERVTIIGTLSGIGGFCIFVFGLVIIAIQ